VCHSFVLIDNRGNRDPSVNLAIEEYVLRNIATNREYLFLYENRPSVVIGRHQLTAREANLSYCHQQDIPILRRISGGGSVFHDPGNVNFSFITKRTALNVNRYRRFLQPIIRTLRDLDVRAEIDARNNILIDGCKISGNAQFASRKRLLSHGTLLFDTDLDKLRQSLHTSPERKFTSHASPSASAEVTNIGSHLKHSLSRTEFKTRLLHNFFVEEPVVYSFYEKEWQEILHLSSRRYRSWDWNYGRSPKAGISMDLDFHSIPLHLFMELDSGKISAFRLTDDRGKSYFPGEMERAFLHLPYDYSTLSQVSDRLRKRFLPDFPFEKLFF